MPQGLADTLCGSPLYMAPEIIQNQKYDAKVMQRKTEVMLILLVGSCAITLLSLLIIMLPAG
jgi:serine/threonine-protein kinase ULK/ATG1